MPATATAFEGGFHDPVLQAQATFRATMAALAEPGVPRPISTGLRPPGPLNQTAGALALTLVDGDTPVWLDPSLVQSARVAEWLTFRTGAPIVRAPEEAAFAFVSDPVSMPSLSRFAPGVQAWPDRSTTVVLQVSDLEGGARLMGRGPGVRDTVALAPDPLPREFVAQWRANNAMFPRGVDILLAAPRAVVGLPRTLRIEPGEVAPCT